MRPLIINEEINGKILELRKFAEDNPRTLEQFELALKGQDAAGDNPKHVLQIPFGYKVCFSIEEFPKPYGMVKRFSVSIASDEIDRMPNIAAVDEMLPLFAIADGCHQVDILFLEDLPNGGKAIAVTHLMDRHVAETLETTDKLPSKELREQAIKDAGMFFGSLHEMRNE